MPPQTAKEQIALENNAENLKEGIPDGEKAFSAEDEMKFQKDALEKQNADLQKRIDTLENQIKTQAKDLSKEKLQSLADEVIKMKVIFGRNGESLKTIVNKLGEIVIEMPTTEEEVEKNSPMQLRITEIQKQIDALKAKGLTSSEEMFQLFSEKQDIEGQLKELGVETPVEEEQLAA